MIGGRALAPMMCFDDVPVQYNIGRESPGASWPQFYRQYGARQLRQWRPVCIRPDITKPIKEEIIEDCVFLGALDNHFGHIVAEAVPRALPSITSGSHHTMLITTRKGMPNTEPSPVFKSVMSWIGLPFDKVRFVNAPVIARKLWVAPQAEHLEGAPPPEEYLDVLDRLAETRGVKSKPDGVVYVSRAKLPAKLGGFAGEKYLVDILSQLGVAVFYPEDEPLQRQMTIYANAKRLVFAEGSAVHGRQLLGRIHQDIDILQRRLGSQIAAAQIAPRSSRLGYVPASFGSIAFLNQKMRPWPHSMVSLFDLHVMFDYFRQIGIPLRSAWDSNAYHLSRDQYVVEWLAAIYSRGVEHWLKPHNPPEYILEQLEVRGLGHLCAQAATIIANSGEGGRSQ